MFLLFSNPNIVKEGAVTRYNEECIDSEKRDCSACQHNGSCREQQEIPKNERCASAKRKKKGRNRGMKNPKPQVR